MATNTLHTGQLFRRPRVRSLRIESQRQTEVLRMLCSWCVLALYLLLEEISAVVLPSSFRNKSEIDWVDQELFIHLPDHSDQGDVSVGDAGDTGRDVHGRPSKTFIASTEDLPLQHQNQFHFHHKVNEKRRKVTPVDSIGSFQMSSSRNRKDEAFYQA